MVAIGALAARHLFEVTPRRHGKVIDASEYAASITSAESNNLSINRAHPYVRNQQRVHSYQGKRNGQGKYISLRSFLEREHVANSHFSKFFHPDASAFLTLQLLSSRLSSLGDNTAVTMFYSHEVLTSRKYGVATVWLVATLGSKSGLKKVSRKAILDVDVAKTCDTIITPDAPMALRLQSNLLYGVTRVYAQQCGYVLTDAENAKNNMRAMLKVMRTSQLDAEGGNKARADQLVLQDDPNFLPELDLLSLNFDAQMTGMENSQRSASTMSPGNSQLTAPLADVGGILIPQSASSFAGGPVGGGRAFSVPGDSGAGSRIGNGAFQHEPEGLLEDDLGMVIDEEGNVTMVEDLPARQSVAPMGRLDRTSVLSEGHGSAGIRPQQSTPAQGDGQLWQPDDDGYIPIPDDNGIIMADDSDVPLQKEGSVHHSTTSETAGAPARRRRVNVRILSLDNATELHGQDLNRWQQEYLQNMLESRQHKQATRLTAVAKQNAHHWVLGSALNHLTESGERSPLSMFSGIQLLEAMTGKKLTSGGEKRPRDEDPASDDSRRVRSRGEPSSDEMGRGIQQEDDGYMPVIDDYEIEQGRDQPTPLDDRNLSSVFPWNQSAGSQRPTGLFGVNVTSSIGGIPLGPISRRGSRLTTASPLLGRSEVTGGEDVLLPDSNPDIGFTGLDDFELFGPAADVDTQTAAQSQWVRTALDGESANFLTFVQAGIDELDEKREELAPDEGDDESMMGSVDFDHLLPPEKNTYIVAAQALLHVLTLGTKNAITVKQDEAYGRISMRVVEAY
ncbi:R8 protein [Oleoguttula sp. CCFEE 5521]